LSKENRKKIIQEIEKKRNSKVIAYVTSDRPDLSALIAGDVVSLVHEHILALKEEERAKLDLFIYSRGGQSDVPWSIVSMFREFSQKGSFSVLIPYRAHSAATVIALGADEIVMTKKAELGPIDITMGSGPYNPTEKDSNQRLPISVEDVTGYFSLLEKVGCERPDEKMKGFELLTNHVHPLALGTVSRLLEETKLVALRLLSTRADPFSEEENHEIMRRISSEVYSHNHAISRTEAVKYIGLKQVKSAEEEDIDIADELWALYGEYKELFHFEDPFKPEEYLISNNLEEYTWTDLNLACVESLKRFDICKKSMRVKRLRQVPPTINLNLTNLNLPAINIPNLPPNVSQEQINAIVQQVVSAVIQQSLNNAVQLAVQQLIQSLPQAGFERFAFNSGWKKEE
jgi:hypothetical protein